MGTAAFAWVAGASTRRWRRRGLESPIDPGNRVPEPRRGVRTSTVEYGVRYVKTKTTTSVSQSRRGPPAQLNLLRYDSSISSSLRTSLTSAAFLAYDTVGSAQMALMVFWRSTTERKTSSTFADVANPEDAS